MIFKKTNIFLIFLMFLFILTPIFAENTNNIKVHSQEIIIDSDLQNTTNKTQPITGFFTFSSSGLLILSLFATLFFVSLVFLKIKKK